MPIDRCAFRPVPAALALALYAAGAAANPQGGVVKAGSATIAPNGNRLDVIQSSQRAVIDWRSFSIGAGGHVNFKQPSAAGATLNRVTGPEMSAILGRLTANGTVFLVNPNGILIGPGAKIDVGGLIAATANISNENFMAGRYKFDEVVNRNAVIVNRGEITAHAGGLVALVAPGVENSGVIRAELGRVVLASGNRFTLDLFGDKLVTFAVDDKVAARLTDVDGRPLTAYVNQTGTIEAGGGSILIAASAAKAVLDNVINTSGVVRATSFVQRGGEIVLHGGDEGVVRVAGTLDASGRASGASGGSVKVLGAEVVLDAGSRIDVAGDTGGGTALVGGGVQGGGGVPRSSRTAIEAGATVNADALTLGNGGTIVAWSDGDTRFAGALSARGGANGGDGGFVEVSGKRELAFNGAVDVGAPVGKGGRLLLDPESLIVDAATATSLSNSLRTGASEIRIVGGTIDVQEPIDGRFGVPKGGLTFEAGDAIVVRNDIVTNDGAVGLKAGAGGITMEDGPDTSVTRRNGVVIYTGNAPISLESRGDVTAQHLVTTGRVSVCSGQTGAVTCVAPAVTFKRDLGGTLGDGIGALAVNAGRSVQLAGVKTTGAVEIKTLDATGAISLDGPIDAGGKVSIGDPARSNLAAFNMTTIRLSSDIHTRGADIELNGRVLINPHATASNVVYLTGFPFVTEDQQRVYEVPMVQVSLQTTGGGNVRFRGDALWDYTAPPNNALKYIYNAERPAGFVRTEDASVKKLRDAEQQPRSTGYYGLNIALATGTVHFGGNLGTLDGAGNSLTRLAPTTAPGVAPKDVLGKSNPANGLMVKVSASGGTQRVAFASTSIVETPLFRVVRPAGVVAIEDRAQFSAVAGRPQSFKPFPGGNLPDVRVDDGNPGEIGPGPRNVARPSGFDRIAALPEVPIRPTQRTAVAGEAAGRSAPDAVVQLPAGGTEAALDARVAADRTVSPAERLARSAPGAAGTLPWSVDLGRGTTAHGAAPDVFADGTPLVSSAAGSAAADDDYFSQGAFEFVQTLSRRSGE